MIGSAWTALCASVWEWLGRLADRAALAAIIDLTRLAERFGPQLFRWLTEAGEDG